MIKKIHSFRQFKAAFLPVALFAIIFFSGCLTADHKEIRLTLSADGKSGTGKITFANIVSEPDDSSKDNSKDDFNNALITEY